MLGIEAGREYRALMVFCTLPAGCIAVPVTDSESEPHLHAGEFAIVDPHDLEPVSGELFLIRWMNGREAFVSVKERGPEGWMIGAPGHPWAKAGGPQRPVDECLRLAARFGAVDGPISRRYLIEKLQGRVVGVLGEQACGTCPRRVGRLERS